MTSSIEFIFQQIIVQIFWIIWSCGCCGKARGPEGSRTELKSNSTEYCSTEIVQDTPMSDLIKSDVDRQIEKCC